MEYTRSKDRVGRWAFIAYVGTLTLLYLASVIGPPPPSWEIIAWTDLAAILFALWPAWFDRHRKVSKAPTRNFKT